MSDPIEAAAAAAESTKDKVTLTIAADTAAIEAKLAELRAAAQLDFTAELAKARAEFNSPHGHMVFGVFLYALGIATGVIMHLVL